MFEETPGIQWFKGRFVLAIDAEGIETFTTVGRTPSPWDVPGRRATSSRPPQGRRSTIATSQHAGSPRPREAAGLNPPGKPKLTPHDLRHSYGSHLILNGLDVVRVSRQLGHANPTITLSIYPYEFEQVQHAGDVDAKLTAAFGGIL